MSDQNAGHWAGIATLRVQALDLLPGFARVTSSSTDWTGEFVAGGAGASVNSGEAVELLLPREAVVRASVQASGGPGIFKLCGESPWPTWSFEPAAGTAEPVARSGILEIRSPTVITSESWLRSEDLPLQPDLRVLLDYRPLQEILVPLEWFFAAAIELRDLNAKVAAVLGGQIGLGLMRAAKAHGDLASPAGFRAFSDYDEARLWLMS